MEKIRTFIAVPLPEEIRQLLAAVIDTLRVAAPEIKWVKPETIHLTLKFLGGLTPAELQAVCQALDRVFGQPHHPFSLTAGGVGAFPDFKRPRVLWVGVQGDSLDRLRALQAEIEDALHRRGFDKEERPFSPHLTLGRIKFLKHFTELREALRTLDNPHRSFNVTRVDVMRSDLKPGGAVYSVLKQYQLKPDIK